MKIFISSLLGLGLLCFLVAASGCSKPVEIGEHDDDGQDEVVAHAETRPSDTTIDTEMVPQPPEIPFVEIYLEVSQFSLPESLPDQSARPGMEGYLLSGGTEEQHFLYPLTGRPLPDAPNLCIGTIVLVSGAEDSLQIRDFEFDRHHSIHLQPAKYRYGVAALLVESKYPQIDVHLGDDGQIKVQVNDQSHPLQVGETKVLFTTTAAVSLDELVQAEIKKQAGTGARSPAEVRAELLKSVPEPLPEQLHLRVAARLVGPVTVASFDALHCWNKAQQLAETGPYEDAEEQLELVLQVLPDHEQARQLYLEILRRLEEKIQPGQVRGKLVLPAGKTLAEMRPLWEKTHYGFVRLIARNPNAENQEYATAITNGTFQLGVPQGSYRLEVHVPGFASFQRDLEITAHSEINVELAQ